MPGMRSTAQNERATSVEHLPIELQLKVLDFLDDPSLCTLGVTSKHFNDMVFPYFFSKHEIISPEVGSLFKFSFGGPGIVSDCILRAVRCCLKAKHITVISIGLDGDIVKLLDDIGELMAIIKQTKKLRKFVLHSSELDSWARKVGATLPEDFGLREWKQAYEGLIEAVVEKQCAEMTLFGGTPFLAFLQKQYRPNTNVVPTRSLGSEASSIAPQVGKKCAPPSRLFFQRASCLFHRDKRDAPGSIITPGRLKVVSPPEAKISVEQPQSGLKTVNLHSSILFTPGFTDWTTRLLHHNAHNITHFVMTDVIVSDDVWNKVLTALVFPNLTDFTISSLLVVGGSHISPSTLAMFLSRHPKIQQLDVHSYPNLKAPSPLMTLFKSPILPNLTHITIHPTTLRWILDTKKSWVTVKQLMLSSVHYVLYPGAFDHQLLDNALEMLVSRNAVHADLSLGFGFGVQGPLNAWLQSHIDAKGSSILSHFTGTKTLVIESHASIKMLCPERIRVFAQWVALFPNVEEISLQNHPRARQMTDSQIVHYLRRWCPRVAKLHVNTTEIIDVHAFEEGPDV